MRRTLILIVIMLSGLYATLASALTLSSTAFAANQAMPLITTCEGRDKIPDLFWSNIPAGTVSFVLIMEDIDAPSGVWVHWVVFNIPVTTQNWQSNRVGLPGGTLEGQNSWKGTGYRGPCPPPGKDHRYVFNLYAVDKFLDLPTGATAQQVREAIKDHIVGQAQLTGIYRRSV